MLMVQCDYNDMIRIPVNTFRTGSGELVTQCATSARLAKVLLFKRFVECLELEYVKMVV